MKKSRKTTYLTCLECGKEYKGGKHLSFHVQQEHLYSSYDEYKIKYNLLPLKVDLKSEGAVECIICGLYSHDLTSHITRTHKMKVSQYKVEYGGKIRSQKYLNKQSERIKGNKNPAYNHGGKYSPLSDKFIHKDTTSKEDVIRKISTSIKNNGNNSTTIKYWLKQGYTEEESLQKLKERQTTFTLEKCIEKYGEEKGREKWLDRQEKWQESFQKSRKNGYSQISQELFWNIFKQLKPDEWKFIHFAELNQDKKKDETEKNNEYRLRLPERLFIVDFINLNKKKIIEFDGTYWHGKVLIENPTRMRDEEKDKLLNKNGYQVLRIKESDYRINPDDALKRCLEFLNG